MNNDIIIDANSGISVEEQREILSQINGITEKNKRQLSENAPVKKEKITAKKKGFIFPLTVNIAAAVFLGIGMFLLISFNRAEDVKARTGNAVYNLTERALIEEIRNDTAVQIAAKESEITVIAARLEEIGKEINLLYSGNESLPAEQIAARERLLAAQRTFHEELAVLNAERSQILESSREKEARIRSQLEERTRELAAARLQASVEAETAVNELAKLSSEQERIAAIDAHFAGGLALTGDLIQKAQYDHAAQTAAALRDFLNVNTVTNSVLFRAKKEYYNQSLYLLDTLIADAKRNSADGQMELITQNIRLQETVDSMQRTISASATGSSGQTQRIREMEETAAVLRGQLSSLRAENATLTENAGEKDRVIASLRNENSTLTSANSDLRSNNTSLTSNVTEQRNIIEANEKRIADLTAQLDAIRLLLREGQPGI